MQLEANKAVLALLSLVIIASGCADSGESGVTVSQTDGVTVESFSATPSEVFGGQPATLELQVKNSGSQDTTHARVKLYNIPFSGSQSWDISQGSQEMDLGTLRAADPDTDSPAVTKPQTWTLEAPDLDSGVSIPYDVHARLFYSYQTTATSDIQVMSGQQFRESGATRSRPTIDNTGGPIQMEVRSRTPVVFFGGSEDNPPSADMCVIANNVGGGTPFDPEVSEGDFSSQATDDGTRNRIEVTLEVAGSAFQIDGDSSSQTKEVTMVGNQGVSCFTLEPNSFSSGDIQATLPVTITADYNYYLDTQTSITVNGR